MQIQNLICVPNRRTFITRILGVMVMPRTAQRPDRISLRLSPQAKRKLERAAAYSDKTLTDFVVDVALQKADAIVREHEVITLSTEYISGAPGSLASEIPLVSESTASRSNRVCSTYVAPVSSYKIIATVR